MKYLFLLGCIGLVSAQVDSIEKCPSLKPRNSSDVDVTDLRVDDIKVIAALGDSMTAGFDMFNVDNNAPIDIFQAGLFKEYRGQSFSLGGDPGAFSIANFVQHYSPLLYGASISSHMGTVCLGKLCKDTFDQYHPDKDNLNVALSGALALNLDFEIDYLISRLNNLYSISGRYHSDWKMINFLIGANDQCSSCGKLHAIETTPEAFGNYVDLAIQRIKKEIPKVIINLLGPVKVGGLYDIVGKARKYCKERFLLYNEHECECYEEMKFEEMNWLSEAYSQKIEALSLKYAAKPGDTFGVMYSPLHFNTSSFPIDTISNVDCFHFSLQAHQWMAKTIWNQMFTTRAFKPTNSNYDPDLEVRCPTLDDRFPIIVAKGH
ncbi:hypothetical protein BY458DRAFT_560401 [Sporodiniella umbellata]|nr:hypothetical protein BY458DRAFT_560401 [Sporodiniella umbellata]